MREIKFRGKQIEFGMWVYGCYYYNLDPHKEENTISEAYIREPLRGIGSIYEVKPETVGQFTGLKDMNGDEIYEGDIIVASHYPFYDNEVLSYVGVLECFDDSLCFGYEMRCVNENKNGISDGICEQLDATIVWEVIGNIHDNPELLERR